MSAYKQAIHDAMVDMAKDPLRRFVGYNVLCGRAAGSLDDIPEGQLVETPVAENLMAGVAIGLSLAGFKPVLYFERCDFILNAMDALVNHLDKIESMSGGQFAPFVLIRVVVGNRDKPLFTGPTHTQNFSAGLAAMVKFPVVECNRAESLLGYYQHFDRLRQTAAVFEFKDLY